MFEIEQKYVVEQIDQLIAKLEALGAVKRGQETHEDTYYAHPSRDFRETKEALRVRRANGIPLVTYKGPRLPGEIKARRELEWRLAPGDSDGSKMCDLLKNLGFSEVATVRKSRDSFQVTDSSPLIVIDQVERLGCFAEIERVVDSESEIETARRAIEDLAIQLKLKKSESQSYLGMLLQLPNS